MQKNNLASFITIINIVQNRVRFSKINLTTKQVRWHNKWIWQNTHLQMKQKNNNAKCKFRTNIMFIVVKKENPIKRAN
jgi:hypothetical protein